MNSTRNLSIVEYFNILQREYLIADFHRKIYYNPKDKCYYKRVMNHKAEKIQDIACRNHLDSILTSCDKMNDVRRELFDMNGKPLFEMSKSDFDNYYSIGNDFSYLCDVWKLKKVNDDNTCIIYSESRKEEKNVSIDKICRIL